MNQLELKSYSRQEIADLLGLDKSNKHFTRQVSTILSNWGYDFDIIPRKGIKIIRQPQTAKERLSEIMIRKYDLDIKTDVYAFAVFFCLLLEEPCFTSQPWEEREEYLADELGYRVSERTLRKWCSVLLKHGTITKNKDKKTYWRTFYVSGKKYREEEDADDKERLDYWKEFWKLKKEQVDDIPKKLWEKYGTCHYACYSLEGTAWDDNEREIFNELIELVEDISNEGTPGAIIRNTNHIIDI